MKKINIWNVLLFVLSAELAGALSALVAGGNFGDYYDTLAKPPLAPPSWLFPVMWAIMYALMGISAYLINETDDERRRSALLVYIAQLAANVLWTPVFFGLKSFGGAVAVIAVMLVLIVCMMIAFSKIRRSAALMNIPYLIWTAFATYLTVGFFILNT